MTTSERILLENKAWASEKLALDRGYFTRLKQLHSPKILWIESSDSLVPVREITNTEPGEIIVHRNMGNLVKSNDMELMATLEHAVEIASVKHIILCGYSHSSSLREVIDGNERHYTREWLSDLKQLYHHHKEELDTLSGEEKETRLAELNIIEQVKNLSQLEIIRSAWNTGDYPKLYGWYFDLNTGLFREVVSMENNRIAMT